jgi:hypothetical protein
MPELRQIRDGLFRLRVRMQDSKAPADEMQRLAGALGRALQNLD